MTDKPQLNPYLKLALELGPLVLFFLAYWRFDFFVATAVFVVTVLIALAISYALTRHLPHMAIISAAIVVVFGGLTVYLQNETFFKMKPTIVYLLFAGVLVWGLFTRRPLLALVFDSVFNLTDEGWRKLMLRWAVFFFVLALANEI